MSDWLYLSLCEALKPGQTRVIRPGPPQFVLHWWEWYMLAYCWVMMKTETDSWCCSDLPQSPAKSKMTSLLINNPRPWPLRQYLSNSLTGWWQEREAEAQRGLVFLWISCLVGSGSLLVHFWFTRFTQVYCLLSWLLVVALHTTTH